jgi:phosphate transport system substrate-binding protein
MMHNRVVTLALAGALLGTGLFAQAGKVDSSIPGYQKTSGVSGNVSSVGSDTLNNLMTLWAESFRKQYPNVRIQIEAKGSSTAPPALIQGTSQLGPMSREMKASEIDEFEKKYGYKPTPIKVAVDGIGVFVHKDNPIAKLTLQEVDAIFSKGRACGGRANLDTWAKAGNKDAGRSASTAATPPPAPTASSRSTCSARATTRTR